MGTLQSLKVLREVDLQDRSAFLQSSTCNSLILDESFSVVNFDSEFRSSFSEIYGTTISVGDNFIDTLAAVSKRASLLWRSKLQGLEEDGYCIFTDSRETSWGVYRCEVVVNHVHLRNASVISVLINEIVFERKFSPISCENSGLRSILEAMDNGVCMINRMHEIVEFNGKFEKFCSDLFDIKLAHGRNLLAYIHHATREKWRDRFNEGFNGEVRYYTDEYPTRDGQVTIEFKVYPIYENGLVHKLTISTLDVSRLKQSETLLKIKDDELVKVNREIDKFVYSTSHDLRSPLSSVKGLINILKIDDDPLNIRRCLTFMEDSIDKLDLLISNIISYSHNSRNQIQQVEVDFQSLIAECLSSVRTLVGFERMSVNYYIQANSASSPLSDINRLRIIFYHLVSNAIQFQDETKKSQLDITINYDDDRLELTFSDNGIGINREFIPRIFEMFFRASTLSTGAGLGLYLVSSAVSRLGGNIRVDSEIGRGSTFVIQLPRREEQQSA